MVDQSTDLRLIARCANCAYEEIKELNPELKRWVTPPQYANYVVKIPTGSKDLFLSNYAAVPAEQKIKWERRLVQKGDTLAGLARKYNTTPEALRDINRIKKDRVIPGRHILIPLDLNSKTQDLSYLAINQGSKLQDILYRVRRGETLGGIARNHNVTVADIREWNKGLGRSVRAGQKIKLIVDSDQI